MKHSKASLNLSIFEPKVFGDDRGFFLETWNAEKYQQAGLTSTFTQDNLSRSTKGVLRGLHYQSQNPQGKLVSVLDGSVFDVAVDIRLGSPYFGQWFGLVLDGTSKKQMFVPEGFAHGFIVLSDSATFMYKCTSLYQPEHEHTLLWSDPAVGIAWPTTDTNPILSAKDSQGFTLDELKIARKLPAYNVENSDTFFKDASSNTQNKALGF
jgi:dTDP-4-dehydrorhamnose 3,5-epimerase